MSSPVRHPSSGALAPPLAGLALALALAAPASATPGAITMGQGAKGIGRAGADTAVFDDATSLARNPATIMESYRFRVDAHFGFLFGRTAFKNELNDDESLGNGFPPVPTVAFTWDPFAADPADPTADAGEGEAAPEGKVVPPADSRFRVGFGIFVLAGGGGGSELVTDLFPEGETEDTSFFVAAVAPTFAFRLTETLSLGFQPQLLLMSLTSEGLVGETDGDSAGLVSIHRDGAGNPLPQPQPFLVSGEQVTWNEVFDLAGSGDGNATNRVEIEDAYGVGVSGAIGLHWRPVSQFSVGIAYQFEGWIPSAKGKATVDAQRTIDSLSNDPVLTAVLGGIMTTFLPDGGQAGLRSDYDFEIKDFKTPAVLSVGVAYRPLDRWLVSLDFRWVFWKHAFDVNDVVLSGGTSRDINEISGSDTILTDNKQEWRDSYVVSVGTAVGVTDWLVLRGGYAFGSNPITEGNASPTSGITEHHVALGGSVYVGGWDFDLAYMYALPNEMEIVRHNSLRELDDTRFKSEQHWLYFGVGYQF